MARNPHPLCRWRGGRVTASRAHRRLEGRSAVSGVAMPCVSTGSTQMRLALRLGPAASATRPEVRRRAVEGSGITVSSSLNA